MGGLTERVGIMSSCMKVSTFHDTDQGPSVRPSVRCIYAQSGKGLNHNDYSKTGKL